MPRLNDSAINSADLLGYLNGFSDFAFELKTLEMLRAHSLECEHGGLYEDPVTNKMREFDIRAVARNDHFAVHLAVECKNVQENYPLLVTCVPRHPSESYHEVAILREPNAQADTWSGVGYTVPALQSRV